MPKILSAVNSWTEANAQYFYDRTHSGVAKKISNRAKFLMKKKQFSFRLVLFSAN